ncbi:MULTISPECIES: FxLYD domain-containing protein [Pseudomonadaceae]|uniref:FxLYD domain-containing protein n=1 Tax=Pseudomonadaceae TaxID=135621 RepID=UPI001112F675|nr:MULTISPECIES: FxLYD domain-containing protein [Pseudomonas]
MLSFERISGPLGLDDCERMSEISHHRLIRARRDDRQEKPGQAPGFFVSGCRLSIDVVELLAYKKGLNGKMDLNMKKTLFSLLVVFSTLTLANERVDVSEISIKNDGAFPVVTGLATNVSDSPINTLFLKFKLYRNGEVVGNTIDQASDIGPGEKFRFSAPVTVEFDEARLSSVDTY